MNDTTVECSIAASELHEIGLTPEAVINGEENTTSFFAKLNKEVGQQLGYNPETEVMMMSKNMMMDGSVRIFAIKMSNDDIQKSADRIRGSAEAILKEMTQERVDAIKKKIVETPIIVGTTSTMQARQEIFSLKHFSLCIIDEASQILEPSVIGLLASEQIERFILIGDHKQLPAVVQQSEMDSYISNPQLRALCIDNCRQSLFERLLRWEQHQGRTQFIGTLRYQGRMHPEVAQFPATAFYTEERLLAVPLPHQQERVLAYQLPAEDRIDEVLKEKRVVFFDSGVHGAYEASGTTGSDKVNICEARMVADLLRRIHRFYGKRFSAQKTVGVIVPYRNQIAMIRQEISQLGIAELLDVSIDTVERYQGSQRDVIIYSFTISHTYQLDFLAANTFMESGGHIIDRKLNVALTRARCQMLMIGNASVLSQNDLFRKLIEQYSVTFH